jgi:hypothetical protein
MDPEFWDTCEIVLWQGYVKAQFYARPLEEDLAIATSPAYWSVRGPVVPDDPQATAALDALVETLNEEGWEEAGRGPAWYARRFRRPLDWPW